MFQFVELEFLWSSLQIYLEDKNIFPVQGNSIYSQYRPYYMENIYIVKWLIELFICLKQIAIICHNISKLLQKA